MQHHKPETKKFLQYSNMMTYGWQNDAPHIVEFMRSIIYTYICKCSLNFSAWFSFTIWREFLQRRSRKQPLIKFFNPVSAGCTFKVYKRKLRFSLSEVSLCNLNKTVSLVLGKLVFSGGCIQEKIIF